MLGLFGSLNLGRRSLQTQQQGLEITGHNLANVNNPAYARQRANIQTSISIPDPVGPQGTGADVVSIQQLRDSLIDRQVVSEISTGGSWQGIQQALEAAQSGLGQQIDRHAAGPEGAAAAAGIGGQQGIAEGMHDLFAGFQSLSADPSSMAERQTLLQKAAGLTTRFNQTSQRLGNLNSALNDSVVSETDKANELMGDVARLNGRIVTSELVTDGVANDLRDLRQSKLEELAKLTSFDSVEDSTGAVNLVIDGVSMVNGDQMAESLETYDAGGGQLQIRAQSTGAAMSLGGGHIRGTIDARDGDLADLRNDIDDMASLLISEVNAVHSAGYGLTGATGSAFFTGTDASDIAVNATLSNNPSMIQASAVAGASGDNQTALALAQLADKRHASLGNQTFSQSFAQSTAALGQALAVANGQVADQEAVESMLKRQRDSISGVSVDEEMTDLMKYQRAYQASAQFISTIDEMLQTVVSMKR